MATIKLGVGISDIRGSIGGTTFSRNAGGAYARQRVKAVNPNSARQNTVRARTSYLTKAWGETLDDDERADWRAYAAGTSWTNRLGDTITINGLAAFVRLNTLRMMAGLAISTAAPLAMGHAGNPTFTFTATVDDQMLNFTEPSAPFVNNVDDHTVIFFQPLPVGVGRLAGSQGFRYRFTLAGSVGSPPAYPYAAASGYTFGDEQNITVRGVYIDPSNRVGTPVDYTVESIPS